MPVFLDNLGLGFIRESDDTAQGFIGHILRDGKAVAGYYGFPYFNLHLGKTQMIARTIRNDAESLP